MKRIQEEKLYLLDEGAFLAQLRDLIDLYKDQTGVEILRTFYELLRQLSDEQREMVRSILLSRVEVPNFMIDDTGLVGWSIC
jgi:hypothetical protein